jgi:hypothetical protein
MTMMLKMMLLMMSCNRIYEQGRHQLEDQELEGAVGHDHKYVHQKRGT